MEIIRTNRMINANYTTLNQRPKAFNAVGVDIPLNINLEMVLNPKVSVANSSHVVVARKFIRLHMLSRDNCLT